MPSVVALTRCSTYERHRVREAVREVLHLVPGMADRLASKPRVLLKPNLLSPNDPPERAVNTHPEFVRAVARYFQDAGCAVLIGDSCGSLSPGSTHKAITVTGLDKMAAEIGAEIVDFDRAPAMELDVPNGRLLRTVRVPKIVREVDLFVTLPKFKTHGLTTLTGAVKNQLGLVPGKGKKDMHLLAPKPALMAEALLDIHSVVRPHLAIMDGILGMEGNGPAAGKPREAGLVLASDDCIALDAVVAEVMGFAYGDVDTVRLGHERGLGAGKLDAISVRGLSLAEARLKDFAKPPPKVRRAIFNLVPDFVIRRMFDAVGTTYVSVLDDRCILCGECVANCPAQALRNEGGRITANRALCISCYCCSEVCERRAIEMRRPFAGRILQGMLSLLHRK